MADKASLACLMVLSAAWLTCCATKPANGMTEVRGDELRRILTNTQIAPFGAVGSYERFCGDGTWYNGNVRTPRSGIYRIEGAEFCVLSDDSSQPQCRTMYRDAGGQFFAARTRPSDNLGPGQLAIERLEEPCTAAIRAR